MLKYKFPPTVQQILGNATKYYNRANESYAHYLICGHVQRIRVLFKRRGEKIERGTLQIDFYRECYGRHSMTSTVCPFCPLGMDCIQKAKVINEERTNEKIKNKLGEAGALAAMKKYFKVREW